MRTAIRSLALCAVVIVSASVAEETRTKMELAMNDGTGADIVIHIDSEKDGFDLHDLQLGESRALSSADGQPVTVTRTADGFDFNVDGRVISMPAMDAGDGEYQQETRIVHKVSGGPPGSAGGVTVISPEPLDDATRTSIIGALDAAGLKDVRFINVDRMAEGPHDMHGPRPRGEMDRIHVIRKEVRVTD